MIPIKFSTSGPVALDLEPNVHQKKFYFLDVFASLVMEKQLLPANLKTKYNGKVPYDVYFPTLQEEDLLVEDIDDELDMVELRPLISIPQRGGVEKIINLAGWMKSPWALKSD